MLLCVSVLDGNPTQVFDHRSNGRQLGPTTSAAASHVTHTHSTTYNTHTTSYPHTVSCYAAVSSQGMPPACHMLWSASRPSCRSKTCKQTGTHLRSDQTLRPVLLLVEVTQRSRNKAVADSQTHHTYQNPTPTHAHPPDQMMWSPVRCVKGTDGNESHSSLNCQPLAQAHVILARPQQAADICHEKVCALVAVVVAVMCQDKQARQASKPTMQRKGRRHVQQSLVRQLLLLLLLLAYAATGHSSTHWFLYWGDCRKGLSISITSVLAPPQPDTTQAACHPHTYMHTVLSDHNPPPSLPPSLTPVLAAL